MLIASLGGGKPHVGAMLSRLKNKCEYQRQREQIVILPAGRLGLVVEALTRATMGDMAGANGLIAQLEKNSRLDTLSNNYWLPTLKASIQLAERNPSESLALLEPSLGYEFGISPRAIQGGSVKAKAAYQDFLTIWNDADPDIPIYKQAKGEYMKLK